MNLLTPRPHRFLHSLGPLLLGGALCSASFASGPAFRAPQALNGNASADTGFDAEPLVKSDGRGGWLAVWTSNENLGGAGTDADLFFARSANGHTWSAPAVLNRNADSDTGGDLRPAMATDGHGHWVVVWDSNEALGSAGTDRDILFARSSDGGVTWSVPDLIDANATNDTGQDGNPDVCVDPSGNWLVVWDSEGTLGNDRDILSVRSSNLGRTWSSTVAVNLDAASDERSDFLPGIACSANGIMMAAWSSSQDSTSNVQTAISMDLGASWTAPVGVYVSPNAEEGEDFAPVIRSGDLPGSWMMVWESGNSLGNSIGDDQDILSSFSDDDGANWSVPRAIHANAPSDDALDLSPALVGVLSGNRQIWVVAWSSENSLNGTGIDGDIWLVYSFDDGQTWSPPPKPLVGFASNDLETAADLSPALATDGRGQWVAAWSSSHNLGGALGTDSDILVVGAGKQLFWEEPQALNDYANLDVGADFRPATATDLNGKVISVWFSNENLNGAGVDQDIFFARSTDGGVTWSPAKALNTNSNVDTGNDRDPQVTFLGNDHWLVAWSSVEDLGGTLGSDPDIFFSRSTDGGLAWSAPAALNSTASSDNGGAVSDSEPALTSDRQGRVVAVWSIAGGFGADFDIAWARSTDEGVSWSTVQPMNPGATADNNEGEFDATVHTSGQGTWISAWFSNSPTGGIGAVLGDDDDLIYRISTDNGATWSAGAVLNPRAAVDGAEEDDFKPRFASDGQGGWIVAWHLEGSVEGTPMDDHDVLITRSLNDGLSWGPQQALNTRVGETANDLFPSIDTDGQGFWVVSWTSDEPHFGGTPLISKIAYVCSSDDGVTWSAPASPNPSDGAGTHHSVAVVFTGPEVLISWAGRTPASADSDILSVAVPRSGTGNPGYRTWLAAFFSSATLSNTALVETVWGTPTDAEQDGLPNLMEFFMALDPTASDSHLDANAVRSGNQVEISYRRNKAAVGHATETVEWSEDMRTWKVSGQQRANGAIVTITPIAVIDAGSHEQITAGVTGVFPLFLRIRVRLN